MASEQRVSDKTIAEEIALAGALTGMKREWRLNFMLDLRDARAALHASERTLTMLHAALAEILADCSDCPFCGAYKPERAGLGHNDGCRGLALLESSGPAAAEWERRIRREALEEAAHVAQSRSDHFDALADELRADRAHGSLSPPQASLKCAGVALDIADRIRALAGPPAPSLEPPA